jgi:hypothetical protein
MWFAMKIVEKVVRWVNPSKTSAILFTRKRIIGSHNDVIFFGEALTLDDHVKYLRIILDAKLNWGLHVETRIKKACMAFGQCRRAIGRTWGLSPKNIRWIYIMIIRPILTYGCHVWWEKEWKRGTRWIIFNGRLVLLSPELWVLLPLLQ